MSDESTLNQEDDGTIFRMVRTGIVTNVDKTRRLARVRFLDLGISSDWLPVLSSAGLPNINAQVLCLYEPIQNGQGFVLGGIQPWR